MDTRAERPTSDASSTPLLSTAFRLTKQLRVILGLKLAEIGMDVGQDHFLVALEARRSVGVGTLAEALGVRASTVSKTVDRLNASGWIERTADPRDMRRRLVVLTPLGGHVRGQVLKIWSEIDADLRASLPDYDDVERQVRVVDDRLKAYLSRLR